MKLKLCSTLLLAVFSLPIQAQDDMSKLITYVKNFGAFFGFDITNAPSPSPGVPLDASIVMWPTANVVELYLFNTYLGAIPFTSYNGSVMKIVGRSDQSGDNPYTAFNSASIVNTTFANYSNENSPVAVNSAVDQTPYQQDPVNQALLNILTTPNTNTCTKNPQAKCAYLTQDKIQENVLGKLPTSDDLFNPQKVAESNFLSQLNVDSLIAPLMYDMQQKNGQSTSSDKSNAQDQGLNASSEAEQAANFIRYATSAVSPLALIDMSEYAKQYKAATDPDKDSTNHLSATEQASQQAQAQASLASYLTGLRVYAAQTSVGISNLYYILSKRIPQSSRSSEKNTPFSQALSEFQMATWRLYSPGGGNNQQWMALINQASPSTVQKEMTVLLAEINYQLYLTRQQQERILLTESLLLLQNARAAQPSAGTTGGTNTENVAPTSKPLG